MRVSFIPISPQRCRKPLGPKGRRFGKPSPPHQMPRSLSLPKAGFWEVSWIPVVRSPQRQSGKGRRIRWAVERFNLSVALAAVFDGANKRHLYDANDSKVSGCCLVESKG